MKQQCELCGDFVHKLVELDDMAVCQNCFDKAYLRADYEYERQKEEGYESRNR